MITVQQIKAARAMLNFSQAQLAQKAHISTGTLNNIERGIQTDPKISTLQSIRKALENAGVEFIERNGEGVGVCLKVYPIVEAVPTVLIVDDSASDRKLYKSWLSKASMKAGVVIEASDAREGYDAFLKYKPSCIILDFMMYGKDGFQMLVEMKRDHPKLPPIIFVTASPSESVRRDVMAMGVHAYLDKKSISKEDLNKIVMRAAAL